MENLTGEEWRKQLNATSKPQIIDVRTQEEYENGHLKNALQIDIMKQQEFMENLINLDKDVPYFVYCRSGNRSAQACKIMEMQGMKTTYNLKGGIMNWDGDIEK
ncbi:rhodanese-like domain-containing protein [Zunongwangia sp. SCSIO 43204]|uniref:rhodanese-like domain-containing protein n=1 Tax=Zunongwangia sp. SCSIO 43204 TaxID=2779359 RepID=UPI001CA8248F|nr:rhodanese-like domain-containing protein [Zunongwangia sp. SCSIO 43204]UAB84415.1 rhodanese-like domain-containing protein [Zunongwangia sp. SCSIO 43204]